MQFFNFSTTIFHFQNFRSFAHRKSLSRFSSLSLVFLTRSVYLFLSIHTHTYTHISLLPLRLFLRIILHLGKNLFVYFLTPLPLSRKKDHFFWQYFDIYLDPLTQYVNPFTSVQYIYIFFFIHVRTLILAGPSR